MENKILIGHDLASGGGMTFVCNTSFGSAEYGTVKEFDTVAQARRHVTLYLDRRIWTVLLVTECPQ